MNLYVKELRIVSPAFTSLERIPKRYTSEGENISPPLAWSGLPPGTQQLALICHDPDAPLARGFTHWVIYGIPPTISQLAEAVNSKFTEGMNSADKQGYTGPTPPVGHGPHHYYFWLYALDKELDLKPGMNREQLQGCDCRLCPYRRRGWWGFMSADYARIYPTCTRQLSFPVVF